MYIEGVSDGLNLASIVLSLQKNGNKKDQATLAGSYESYMNIYIANTKMVRIVGYFVSAMALGPILHGLIEVIHQYGVVPKP